VRDIPPVHVSSVIVLLWLVVWEHNYSVLWVMVQTFSSMAYSLRAPTVESENSRCYVMPARDNRGTVTIRDVTRTAVAMVQLSKHVSTETNSRNNMSCFLCGPYLGVKKDKGS
jgi:hypothetical protein